MENVPSRKMCRICLQEIDKGIELFSEDVTSKDILDKIYSCFQVILIHDNFLPNMMCDVCSDELESANKFRLKCVTFEERYNANFKKIPTIEKKDDSDCDDAALTEEETNDENLQTQSTLIEPKSQYNGFKCDICDKVLKSENSLSKHKVSIHEKRKYSGRVSGSGVSRRYHCSKCPYITPHHNTLENHMRRHTGERPYHCECGKSFTQSASLTAHKKTHNNTMLFVCSVCGKQFKHSFSLKKHLRVHDIGKFQCNICTKTLKSPQALQGHVNRHYNIRNYSCENCGATFVTACELLSHKKKHFNDKQLECQLCGYRTYAKRNLVVHIRRHTGDKSYKCGMCSKTAYTKSDLRRHQRVHSREKPYPCPVCAQKFSHSGTLNQHVKNVHGLAYRWGDTKIPHTNLITIKDENGS